MLTFTFGKIGDKKPVIKIGDKLKMKEMIVAYLTTHSRPKENQPGQIK